MESFNDGGGSAPPRYSPGNLLKTKNGGSGGQRPPDIVPGAAEGAEGARAASGAAGARGETVISCTGEELRGLRVSHIEPQDFLSISFLSYWPPVISLGL